MPDNIWIVYVIAAALVAVAFVLGFIFGEIRRKKKAEAVIGSAETEAKRILNDAYKTAEAKKKEAVLEAKDEIHNMRSEAEKELRERRGEVKQQEHRLVQKEESLDRKTEALEKKDDTLTKKLKEATEKNEAIEKIKAEQYETLQKIAGRKPHTMMTSDMTIVTTIAPCWMLSNKSLLTDIL